MFDTKLLHESFECLGKLLDKHGFQGKICFYDGKPCIFLLDFRKMSYDIDYEIVEISADNTINSVCFQLFYA